MKLFKKILVGMDGSASSLHAFRQILRFSHGEGIPSIAAAVVPPYEGDLSLVGVRDIKAVLRRPCEKVLEISSREAIQEGLSIQTVCLEGKPHEELIAFAVENQCDLIALGPRGSFFEKHLLGSVTAQTIGLSPVDVLTIPLGAAIGWQNILCPVDGSPGSLKAAQRALEIAAAYNASLKIISATDLPVAYFAEAPKLIENLLEKAEKAVQDVQILAARQGLQTWTAVREGDAAEVILNFAETEKVDLVVLGSHGKGGIKKLLMGSTAEKVIGNCPCPVLVVQNR